MDQNKAARMTHDPTAQELATLRDENQDLRRYRDELQRTLESLRLHQEELHTQNDELQQARTQSQAAGDHYRELFDWSPGGFLVVDAKGSISEINLTLCRLLGKERRKLLHRTLWEFLDPEDRLPVRNFVSRTLRGENERLEARLITPNKKQVFVELLGRVRESHHSDQPLCFIATTDISQRKFAEDELLRARNDADAANRAKSAFLANMSHELRTPLNVILGFSQLLQRSTMDKGELQLTQSIQRAGNHLLTLINDVLDLAKIEAGRFDITPERCVIGHFLQSLIDTFGVMASEKGLYCTLELVEPLPYQLDADERRLRQILINLIGNAIKFTDQGGVTLGAHYQQGQLELAVMDTGCGIDPEHLEAVFEPFEQLEGTTSSQLGSGLGLSIVRSLVVAMNGRIQLESRPGEGSCFRIFLPLPPSTGMAPTSAQHSVPSILAAGYQRNDGIDQPLTLMITEDDPENRQVLTRRLADLGFVIMEAEDGEHCIAQAEESRPDLILMDLHMPGMGGLAAIKALKAKPSCRTTPIIATTAQATRESMDECLAAGAEDYILKPISFDQLLAVMQTHLPITWQLSQSGNSPNQSAANLAPIGPPLSRQAMEELTALFRRGKLTEIRSYLEFLADEEPEAIVLIEELSELVDEFQLGPLKRRIAELLRTSLP